MTGADLRVSRRPDSPVKIDYRRWITL